MKSLRVVASMMAAIVTASGQARTSSASANSASSGVREELTISKKALVCGGGAFWF